MNYMTLSVKINAYLNVNFGLFRQIKIKIIPKIMKTLSIF